MYYNNIHFIFYTHPNSSLLTKLKYITKGSNNGLINNFFHFELVCELFVSVSLCLFRVDTDTKTKEYNTEE